MPGFDHHAHVESPADSAATMSRNRRLGLVLFAVYLAFYSGYVLLNAFRPDLADVNVLAGLNLAIVYGMFLIAAAFGLAMLYGFLCRAPAGEAGSDAPKEGAQ